MKIYTVCVAILLFFLSALTVHAKSQSTSNLNDIVDCEKQEKSFLSERWIGGMCRGGLHVVSSPLLVPTSVAYGIAKPFKSEPVVLGSTNYFLYAAEQTIIFPFVLVANTSIAAGGTCLEIFSGVFDLLSLGNFDLPGDDGYDPRPYFIQLIDE